MALKEMFAFVKDGLEAQFNTRPRDPVADRDIEDRAVAFIKVCLDEGTIATGPEALPELPAFRPPEWQRTPKIVLEGTQRDLRRVATSVLLAPLRPARNYVFAGSIAHWLDGLVHGSPRDRDSQLEQDLGLNLARHAAALLELRKAWPKGWRLLCRAELAHLRARADAPAALLPRLDAIIRDHALVLGMLRARLLAEYLRRFATEPMGARLSPDDPV